jgi:tetratricopeptide (TPR) repeat protein
LTLPRKNTLLTIFILTAGAVVRLAFYWQLKDTPLARVPILDSLTYHDWAASLVSGDWGWNQTYWMGPLYPHLLALFYKLFGVGSQAILIFQLVLSLLNVWLVQVLTFRLTSRPEAGLLAAALFSLYGAPVFYAGMLLMATIVTTLYLLIALQTARALDFPTTGNWIKLGLLVGLTGLARGNVLLLLAALPVLLWKACPVESVSRKRLTAALVLSGVAMLLPVTARNLVVADDFVILTSNGGVNLLIGQQADYKGTFAPVMDESQAEFDPSMETTLERELGRDLKGSEVSRILTRRAVDEFLGNLPAMPLHYLRKAYRFWNGYELPQIFSYSHWHRQFAALRPLVLPFFLLSALGLLGLRFLPGQGRWIMIILLGAYFFSLLPFFPTSRYRQPVAPLLAVSSAVFILAMIRAKGPGRLRWLGAALLLTVALLPRWATMDTEAVTWQVHLHEASRASKLGDLKNTLAEGRIAEETRPGLPDTPFHLSVYLEELNAREEALAALRLAQLRAPDNRLIAYKIGRNYEEMGLDQEAVAAYRQTADLDPEWPYPWLRLGLVYRRAGQTEQSLAALEKAHLLGPGNHRVRANLASAYAESGQNEKARAMLRELTRDYPHYLNGWFNLALAELRVGDPAAAQAALDRASELPRLTATEKDQITQLQQVIQRVKGP